MLPLKIFNTRENVIPVIRLCNVATPGVTYLPSWELILASIVVNIPANIEISIEIIFICAPEHPMYHSYVKESYSIQA
jgi:hypothetical protein